MLISVHVTRAVSHVCVFINKLRCLYFSARNCPKKIMQCFEVWTFFVVLLKQEQKHIAHMPTFCNSHPEHLALNFIRSLFHTTQLTLDTTHKKLYTMHCTRQTAHYTLYTTHCTLKRFDLSAQCPALFQQQPWCIMTHCSNCLLDGVAKTRKHKGGAWGLIQFLDNIFLWKLTLFSAFNFLLHVAQFCIAKNRKKFV